MQRCSPEWLSRFQARVGARRIPLSGMLELTRRCNLRCVHCYQGEQAERWRESDRELTTSRLLELVDELADAGCLELSLTGGEPLLRADFGLVYRRARERGLIVTVLSNGTLVGEAILALFGEYPPAAVEVSLYGATRETYEAVTRVPGSYERCRRGLRRLVEAGQSVRVKTVLLRQNRHEVQAMAAIAASLGGSLQCDSAVFPRLVDGDRAPLALRLSPEVAVASELFDETRVARWRSDLESARPAAAGERLYGCGAGRSSFFVDAHGFASPCVMTTGHRHRLERGGFARVWAHELRGLEQLTASEGYACNGCAMQSACNTCPAMNELETGAADRISQHECLTTRLRWERLRGDAAFDATQEKEHGA